MTNYRNAFAYFDDIVVASPDKDSHLTTLEAVFERLRQAGLAVKVSKSEFLKKTSSFFFFFHMRSLRDSDGHYRDRQ